MKYIMTKAILLIAIAIHGQSDNYIGAGNNEGVRVSTSSNFFDTDGFKTLDGSGLDAKRMEATRFLAQATLGFSEKDVEKVMELGIDNWLEFQILSDPSFIAPVHDDIFEEAERVFDENKGSDDNPDNDDVEYYGPAGIHFNYAWWQTNMTNEDLLRHRMAFALSELLVISMNSDLIDFGEGLSSYYDLFVKHAFGNYSDLLFDVTIHPCMGYYLSHLNNPKTDLRNNIHPDENYAREIMQLFTIGLYELNRDGSRKLDTEGNYIPTYDNKDIGELAKVFTGLGGSEWSYQAIEYFEDKNMQIPPIGFGHEIYSISRRSNLKMNPSHHEQGEKIILKDHVIPDGQDGIKDIKDAIEILVNHNNTAPFLSRFFIQRLVKSNPSPDYISRVAQVFENDGNGQKGNLGAVVKAILLDPEARSCEAQSDPTSGMLREPIVRYLQFARAIAHDSPLGKYWNNGFYFREETKQHPLMSPTVFNFFEPEYQPVGDLADQNLFGPEFKIHDTQSAVGYINQVNLWAVYDLFFWSWEEHRSEDLLVHTNFSELAKIAEDTEELINRLDVLFTHGRLSDSTRQIIRDAISWATDPQFYERKAGLALYLIMISPDYTILK